MSGWQPFSSTRRAAVLWKDFEAVGWGPHATPGPKRAIALLTLKAEATIPRDLEGENHLMVEGLTEHVLIAAMYATASASRL